MAAPTYISPTPEEAAAKCPEVDASDLHCPLECPTCPLGDPAAPSHQSPKSALQDGRFVLASATYFGLPLLLAFSGAALFAASQTQQFLGALAGLSVGMLLAIGLSKQTVFANRDKT